MSQKDLTGLATLLYPFGVPRPLNGGFAFGILLCALFWHMVAAGVLSGILF